MYHNAPNDREYQFISLIGFPPLKWPLEGEGKRFVTRTTFQGDGLGPAVGIWADESVYVESAPPPPSVLHSHRHWQSRGRACGKQAYAINFIGSSRCLLHVCGGPRPLESSRYREFSGMLAKGTWREAPYV